MTEIKVDLAIFAIQSLRVMSHDNHEEKPEGFLNTVFDSTMGGFGISMGRWAFVAIFLLMLLG